MLIIKKVVSRLDIPRWFLFGLVVVLVCASSAEADDPCGGDALGKFASTLPSLSSAAVQGGRFEVKPYPENGVATRFEISYVVQGKIQFRSEISDSTPTKGVMDGLSKVHPFRVKSGGALFFLYRWGATGGLACSYLVFPGAGQFQAINVGGFAEVTDLDEDGEDEILTLRYEDWMGECPFARVQTPYWRGVLHLDLATGNLVDVSERFPSYYALLASKYKQLYGATSEEFTPECQAGFLQLVKRAESLADTATSGTAPGGAIAFSSRRDGNQEVYLLDVATGGQINLTVSTADDGYPRWSPDASQIAFSSNRDGNWEVYVMRGDGSGSRNLTNNPADDGFMDWSPDGESLVFASKRDGNREIYIIGKDGSHPRRMTDQAEEDVHPTWSPDGRKIAFASERDRNREIYLMNPDGTNLTRLTFSVSYDDYPAWSPDGLQIAFASDRDSRASDRLEIYAMNTDGTGVRRLTYDSADDRHPTWSPDGSMLAFVSNRSGDREIYVMKSDGSNLKRLTFAAGDDEHPHWIGTGKP
jgi:Tol biopolymer transport system component